MCHGLLFIYVLIMVMFSGSGGLYYFSYRRSCVRVSYVMHSPNVMSSLVGSFRD